MALADFQSSSKELEDEMEKELANTERRETELRHEAERLRSDVDAWKVGLRPMKLLRVRAESMSCRSTEPSPRHPQGTLQDYAAYATRIRTFTKLRESIKRKVARHRIG